MVKQSMYFLKPGNKRNACGHHPLHSILELIANEIKPTKRYIYMRGSTKIKTTIRTTTRILKVAGCKINIKHLSLILTNQMETIIEKYIPFLHISRKI